MYPDFHFFFQHVFGIDIPVLSLLKTFGFLVALAFLAGGYIIYLELKRKEADGIIGFTLEEIQKGKPLQWTELAVQAFIGGLIGYKFFGMFADWQLASPDPMSYLFSPQGNLWFGIGGALLGGYLYYSEVSKEAAKGLRTIQLKTWPHTRVGDIAMVAALGGFAGAKIFNALETWDDFVRDPLGSLLSSSGLTFYGGLILATLLLWRFSRKIKLDFRHLCDAAAPALLLAYGIGRLGCQVSGDGDWGIFNSAYMTNEQGKVVAATVPFDSLKLKYQDHLQRHFEPGTEIQAKAISAPAFIPTWLVAYNYPNNVNRVGIPLANCQGDYCAVLPMPVFPTPVYEFFAGVGLFFLLWTIRKRFTLPLSMFSLYLIVNGLERFLVEKIRVNYQYDWGWLHPTQAEIIAVGMMLTGALLFVFRKKIDDAIKN